MNENLWLSIIIPVYNAGKYFEDCLQSVCGNPQLDIEIILIDDGSTDDSGNIAQKWAAKDVRVQHIRQENQGVSAARNHGIELAHGKWIMFVDADDTIELDTVEKLRVLESKFADAEIVCFGCHMNSPQNMMELHKLDSAMAEELALSACGVRRPEKGLPEANFTCMMWKLYRCNFLRRTNLKSDRELVRGEDLLFNCYAFSEAYSIAFSPYDYYNYRSNPQSATRRRNPAIKTQDAVFQKKLQTFANQYRYRHLEQIAVSYSALNGIVVSFFAYFSFFSLTQYRNFRFELSDFLRKDCYQRYLGKKCPGAQYLNREARLLIFLLVHRMYFLSWLLFGAGRKIKRKIKKMRETVLKS